MDLVRGQPDSSGSAEMTTLFFHKTAESDYNAMHLPLAKFTARGTFVRAKTCGTDRTAPPESS
jgi:hypothetical protein